MCACVCLNVSVSTIKPSSLHVVKDLVSIAHILTYEYFFFIGCHGCFVGLQDVVEMAMIRQRLIELEDRMVVLREVKAAAAAAAAGSKALEADLSGMKLKL